MNDNNNIRKKIIQFQKNMPLITKNANNPFFRSEYATLDAIQASIQQPLADAGLGYMQTVTSDGLVTTIFDAEGNYLDSTYPLSIHGKPQEIASAVTYAKRYALTAMLGLIVGGEDDDGNKTQKAKEITQQENEVVVWMTQDQIEQILQVKDIDKLQQYYDLYNGGTHDGKRHRMKKDYQKAIQEHILRLS